MCFTKCPLNCRTLLICSRKFLLPDSLSKKITHSTRLSVSNSWPSESSYTKDNLQRMTCGSTGVSSTCMCLLTNLTLKIASHYICTSDDHPCGLFRSALTPQNFLHTLRSLTHQSYHELVRTSTVYLVHSSLLVISNSTLSLSRPKAACQIFSISADATGVNSLITGCSIETSDWQSSQCSLSIVIIKHVHET